MILVVLGHVLPGSISENPLRAFIYSYHMPVFIAASGYMLNYRWLLDVGFFEIFRKYKNRIIIPWLIAFLVYFIFHEVQRAEMQILYNIGMEFLFPFYHLWFIPAFFSWLIMARIIGRSRFFSGKMFIVSLIISILTYGLYKNIFSVDFIHRKSIFMQFVHETIRPYYFVFFVFGIKFKEINSRFPNVKSEITVFSILILYCTYYFVKNEPLSFLLYYFFNFILIFFILKKISENNFPSVSWIQWLGVNSMGIYLWHVFPIIIIKYFFSPENSFQYYALILISISSFFVFYYFINKIRIFRTMLFGLS
jgi:acyltransferase